jgi:ferritin-like metal-binding protein YciE
VALPIWNGCVVIYMMRALRFPIQHHLEQTNNHVSRLEQIFDELDESPKGESCDGMEGLIEEKEADRNLTTLAESINIKAGVKAAAARASD